MLPKPEYPIDCIAIDYKQVYETLMRIAIAEEMSKTVFDALYAWGKAAGYIDDSDDPKPTKVIFNGPATVVFFEDGSKVVAKAGDGDEFDPLFGLMACAVRKAGRNRARIDSWETVIQFLADNIGSANECRFLADVLGMTADEWELDGVGESMDKWADEKSKEGFEADFGDADPQPESETLQERVRQTVRDLIDRGEL